MEAPAFAVIGSLLTIGSTGNCFFETGVGEDCFLFVFIFQTYRFEIPSQMGNPKSSPKPFSNSTNAAPANNDDTQMDSPAPAHGQLDLCVQLAAPKPTP